MKQGPRVPEFPAREFLHLAVAHQRDAMLITEADRVDGMGRRIVWVNPAFTALTGFSAEETIGQTPNLTIGELSSREAIQKIQTAIESKTAVRQEILKYRKDGTTFWAEVDIAPVFEPDGRCRYFVCLMRDVSEKTHFLSNVSHELRTPLHAMVSYSGLLLEGVYGSLSDEQRRAMERLDSNARHLVRLINEVLDVSRIESGRMPVHRSSFAVGELVAELLAELEPLVARSGLAVSTRIPAPLAPLSSDRQKVKQILVNLVSNAIQFTRAGWVRIEAAESPGSIAITVADSGIGIAPEHHQAVFEPFRQVEGSPARVHGGTGLGLAICRRLAGLLGGSISLESAPGQGAAFTLTLPRCTDEQ